MSLIGAGIRRLWAEKEIFECRFISAAALAREASVHDGPVQARTPWSIILDRGSYPSEVARLLHYFGATYEEAENIGAGDGDRLAMVMAGWEENLT